MGKYTTLAQSYINYINDLRQFSNMPLWQRQLSSYNSRPSKKVTLPPSDKEACLKALNSLPKANYWALSFNLDTFDDFIEEIS